MLRSAIHVLREAIKSAGAELKSAREAHAYFQVQALTKADKRFYLVLGFTRGFARGMSDLRKLDPEHPSFDPSAETEMHFKTSTADRPMLLVDVINQDESGARFPVTSTLSYVEAQSVLIGLNILRGTGIYRLNDVQADNFIREASSMLVTWNGTNPNCPAVELAGNQNQI
jgi:hypothetical protein